MLQLTEPSLTPNSCIIRADEYPAILDADGIIADAKRRAAEIVADAERQYEERKQQGYEDGLNEGRMEMSGKMIDTIASSVDFLSSLENKVVHLVTKCLKKILSEIPQPDRLAAVAQHALGVARNESKVTMRVCPNDVDAIKARMDDILKSYPAINFIDVVGDSRLAEDGCVLETDIGVVDASLDVQLKAIEMSLAKAVTGDRQES